MLVMGSGEPALVPEWYRGGKGAKAPNASSGNRILPQFSSNCHCLLGFLRLMRLSNFSGCCR